MAKKCSTKPKNVDYFRVPRPLWRRIKKHLPNNHRREDRGARQPTIVRSSTGFGTAFGRAVSGKQCIATGSAFRAACCTSAYRPGNELESGSRCFERWSVSMPASGTSDGSGSRSIANRVPHRWAERIRAKTRPIGPKEEARFTFWSMNEGAIGGSHHGGEPTR